MTAPRDIEDAARECGAWPDTPAKPLPPPLAAAAIVASALLAWSLVVAVAAAIGLGWPPITGSLP